MKSVLVALLLSVSPAMASGMSLLGYIEGSKFIGIHVPTSKVEVVDMRLFTAVQKRMVGECLVPTVPHSRPHAVQVVVDFVASYSSDMRTLDPMTRMPNGYQGVRPVIRAVACHPVGTSFRDFWKSHVAKTSVR